MKISLKSLILNAIVLGSLLIQPVAAIAETEITNYAELKGAITQGATNDIKINGDITDFSNSIDLTQAGTILNLNGNHSTITASGTEYTLFNVQAQTSLNIKDTIINTANSNLNGGVINNNSGTINITGSTFKNNVVNGSINGGGVIYSSASGNDTLVIKDSIFTDNSATISSPNWNNGGGAIYYNSGSLTIDNGTFKKNTTNARGGAIYILRENAKISNSDFSENSANAGGAIALVTKNSSAVIKNVSMTKNSANQGGAIFNEGILKIETVDNGETIFSNNIATDKGGAIFSSISATTAKLIINNTTFTENKANTTSANWDQGGGAIYYKSGIMTIDNSTFKENSTNARGGAIFIYGNNATITNSTFTGNSATGTGVGGAIALVTSEHSAATIKNSAMKNNTAYRGGAIFNEGNLTIVADGEDVTFSNNTASDKGGAIYNQVGISTLEAKNGGNITFSDNNASSGSDIYMGSSGNRHSTLNIKGDGTITFNGSIAGENGTINKSGNGTLVLNGDNTGYKGTFTQEKIADSSENPITTVGNGAKFFAGTNNINSGILNWNTENDIDNNATLIINGSSLVVGDNATLTIQGGSSIDNANSITSNGNLILKKNMTIKSIDGTGNITADASTLTFNNSSNLSDNLKFTSNNNATVNINGITDSTNTDKIISKIANGTNNGLTINISDTTSNTDILVDGTNISSLNFSNTTNYNGKATGTGNITNSGTLNITGNQSNFNGTYTQNANMASTTINTSANLFSGEKNINNGFFLINEGNIDYTNIKLGNATFTQTITDTALAELNTSVLEFKGEGHAGFTNGNINLSKIDNGKNNWLVFNNSNVKLNETNYQGETIYNLHSNSTLDLMEKDENNYKIQNYEFDNLITDDTTKLNFNIKIIRDESGNYLTTDTLKINTGYGVFNLNEVYITGEENGQIGEYLTKTNVMQGNSEFVDGSNTTIVGATTSWQYKLNQTNDNKSIKLEIIDYSNSSTLNDMNITNGKRFFQFSNGDTREYHIKESLDATNAGEFNIIGNNKNIISGILDGTTNQKGSFFNIADGTDVKLNIKNVTIQDAEKTGNGSVIDNNSSDAEITITDSIIKNNTSTGNGGAIYNKGTVIVTNTTFTDNASTEKGGAIYTDGNLTLENTTFDAATENAKNDIYVAGGNVILNGKNQINSSISGDINATITNNGILNITSDNSNYKGSFIQSNGSTTVTDKFFGGTSTINNGSLNWQTDSTANLTMNGGQLIIGKDENSVSKLTLTDGSIANNAQVYIYNKTSLDIDGANVSLNENDLWKGAINLKNGELNITNIIGNNKLLATGGTLNIKSGDLLISSDSSISENVSTNITSGTLKINGGNVAIGNTSTWAETGTIKLESGDLNFKDFNTSPNNGTLIANNGNLILENSSIKLGNNSLIKDNTVINLDINSTLNIEGGKVEINNNDDWKGTINLGSNNNGGELYYNTNYSGTLVATSGKLYLLDGSTLNIESPSNIQSDVIINISKDALVNIKSGALLELDKNDTWKGTITISPSGKLYTNNVDNTKTGGIIQVNNGSTAVFDKKSNILIAGNSKIYGGDVSILNDSSVHLTKDVTMNADKLTMKDNSLLNSLNKSIDTNTVTNVDITNTNNFAIDLSPRTKIGDKYVIENLTGNGAINVSRFNFVGLAPIDRNIDFKVFDATNSTDSIDYAATNQKIFTPIGNYKLKAMGDGIYRASLADYNPQVYRGQVATLAAYNNQLIVNDFLTNRFILQSEQLIENTKNTNKTSAVSPILAPYQNTIDDGSVWMRTYASFERLSMTHGLNVGNNTYGTIVGVDMPAKLLNKGWKFIPTVFLGYNGGNQYFNKVDMYQNGVQGGLMATFIKHQFISSIMAYGGGYFNEMNVAGNTDRTGNWFAGAAAKIAYNLKATKYFTIQPNVFVSYNIFGKQHWHTDYGVMSMNSGLLNGINVAPGVNFIYGRGTWSIYTTVQYMYNINDHIGGYAGNVNLPSISMRHGYIQYGFGATKLWKDRLNSYLQITFRNGGRTGVGFQLGLRYMFEMKKHK